MKAPELLKRAPGKPKFLKNLGMTNIGVEKKENINTSTAALAFVKSEEALSAPRTVNITAAAVSPCRRLFCVVIKLRKFR